VVFVVGLGRSIYVRNLWLQDEDCVLQSLSIPDSKLRSDLYNLINALGGNQCLQSIDIR